MTEHATRDLAALGATLAALGERIDHVLRGPAAIEAQLLFRVARPIFVLSHDHVMKKGAEGLAGHLGCRLRDFTAGDAGQLSSD